MELAEFPVVELTGFSCCVELTDFRVVEWIDFPVV